MRFNPRRQLTSASHSLFLNGFSFLILCCLVLPLAHAQTAGTLSGTVTDQNGAVITGAKVAIQNESSGDVRRTVSNGSGNFSVPALEPGSYRTTITAQGFGTFVSAGLVLTEGESRVVPGIRLRIGSAQSVVTVTGEAEAIVPTDTGSMSTALNNHMVSELSITGRDAGELIKYLPGMGINNGLAQGASFTDQVTGTNTGPVGAYSANGSQPNGAMAFMLDGANILDSNMGTQVANVNQDMTSEVKVMTSSYGAEFAKGPVVFEAYGKSGGENYHGEAYLYTRNANLNAENALLREEQIAKPYDTYYYLGGNLGGPVLIPHTSFNRGRRKLFFFGAYEYMWQKPAGTLYEYFVPTDAMRAGDFSAASMATLPSSVPGGDNVVPCASGPTSCNAKMTIPNGNVAPFFDPNALAMLKLYPEPTVDPATHGGHNYTYLDNYPTNRWEANAKINYDISDKMKLFGTYIRQNERDIHSFTVWYAPSSSLPYPSTIIAPTTSNVGILHLTNIFSPTFTNEAVGSYVRYANVNKPENSAAYSRTALGYNGGSIFGAKTDQIPNIVSYTGALPGFYAPSFDGPLSGGGFGKILRNASIYDNLTKVWGKHTVKGGGFWEMFGNEQSSGGGNIFYQGLYAFDNFSSVGTGNPIADFLIGHSEQYSQANVNSVDNGYYRDYAFYAQDSWKVSRKLTLNYGIRFDHLGQWYFPNPGTQVWNPATYSNAADAPANTGLLWHGIDSKIPLSGYPSTWYYEPRASFAYDVYGNATTVVRGGFAVYRYPLGDSNAGAAEGAMGVYQYQSQVGVTSLAGISQFMPSGLNQNGTSISVLQQGDNQNPQVEDYNLTVSQGMPWRSVFELSYVGSMSQNLLIDGAAAYINMVPLGGLFQPDPVTGAPADPSGNINVNDYKPYRNYQNITLVRHGSSSNYNALQVAWTKQSGPVTFLLNYTFGKALGIRDGESDNGPGNGSVVDLFNLKNNYGTLAYNHTNIFNASYVINLPSPIHSNIIAKGAVNGWELSGGTSIQSGVPIQPNAGGNLYATFPSQVSVRTYLGTDTEQMQPQLTCDPRSGAHSNARFNVACFAPPNPGTQGSVIWPDVTAPAYFNSDLSLFKNFSAGESRKVQFRFSAFNFLNHPLPEFNADGSANDLRLNFIQTNPMTGEQTLSNTNTNTLLTGAPAHKVGNRLVELALKYTF
ncbi:carboxypeptidase regulatory-like domain-containing protein [Silvibacterium acidisoli]|uniref:carboxypeptidase regulatory-like domain-containing protein n=1 Tax=Acidobacteriaceae bacterium ZG23-2 TaxID=2883246 RepID=UPI00406C9057